MLFYRRMGPQTWSMQLQPAEMQAFFYPGLAATPPLARHLDYFKAVLRAPIAASEKLRALLIVARRATGDLIRAMKIIKKKDDRLVPRQHSSGSAVPRI
jgi:hypothetical protein